MDNHDNQNNHDNPQKTTKNEIIHKMSDISIQPFTNKKGTKKYQLSLTEEYINLLLNGDTSVIAYIREQIHSNPQ